MKTICLFIVVLFISSFSNAQKVESGVFNTILKSTLKGDVPELSVKEADSIKKRNPNPVFIDTREKKEYNVSHIKDAIWVGYEHFDMNRLKNIDKNNKIIAYCAVGARSEEITRNLIAAGYTDVSNLYGSIFEWVNEGNPVYNLEGKKTNKIHAYSKFWGIWLKQGDKVFD